MNTYGWNTPNFFIQTFIGDAWSHLIGLKSDFYLQFWEFHVHKVKNIIVDEVALNPHKVRLNIGKLRKLEFRNFLCFSSFGCSLQSEVEQTMLVKSTLHEVRFKPREVRLNSHDLRVT